ncbi:hypothetical protein [Nocardia beijingensis]
MKSRLAATFGFSLTIAGGEAFSLGGHHQVAEIVEGVHGEIAARSVVLVPADLHDRYPSAPARLVDA